MLDPNIPLQAQQLNVGAALQQAQQIARARAEDPVRLAILRQQQQLGQAQGQAYSQQQHAQALGGLNQFAQELRKIPDVQTRLQIAQQNADLLAGAGVDVSRLTIDNVTDAGLGQVIMATNQFAPQQAAPKPSDFAADLQSAGIMPGTPEYKAAVLEKYGKGETIGWDVKEAVNPKTGKTEFVQVSRTDPGQYRFTGLEVPASPQEAKAKADQEQAKLNEISDLSLSIDTIQRALDHPGLEKAAGVGSMFPTIAGSDAAGFEALLEQIQSQQFLTNVKKLQGMGALSEAEGRKLSAAAGALSLSMSDKELRDELERIKSTYITALDKAKGIVGQPNTFTTSGGITFKVVE